MTKVLMVMMVMKLRETEDELATARSWERWES